MSKRVMPAAIKQKQQQMKDCAKEYKHKLFKGDYRSHMTRCLREKR